MRIPTSRSGAGSHGPAGVAECRRACAALLIALLFTGCRSGTDHPITLRFWAMGREGEVVQDLVHDFERLNPGIHVEVQQIPWSAAHEKLLTAYVGRSTPDVAQLGNTWIAEFATLHAIVPFDAWLATTPDVPRSGYFPGIWDTNVMAGHTWGVPWYVDTRVLFYRRDLLARAGWASMPVTWDAWRKCMADVKRVGGPGRYAIFLPLNEWNPPMIMGLQAGAQVLGADGTRGAFESPAFRRAFDTFIGFYRDSLAPPFGNGDVANVYQEFARGTFAMYITGPWNLGEFHNRLPDSLQDAWDTAPLPGPNGPGVSMAGGSSLVMFRNCEHPEAAERLIAFLSQPAQQLRFYHLTGDLPARTEAWSDTALASPHMAAFRDQLQRVEPWPMVPEWEQIAQRLQDQVERAVRGGTTPEAALAALDQDVDRMLEKRRWLVAHGRLAVAP